METLCFHPNSNYIATSSLDRILKIWNLLECKEGQQMIPIRQMSGHKLNIYILKFSKDVTCLLGHSDAIFFYGKIIDLFISYN
ncbi:unnamed protein product [Rotaria sordida]|uniref:Uncharacterized protein n=1 Tax=Rotaria sordida TaxID=392033 RepID=A0A815QZT7_9BILA|nr:unnamed protein product [Rotaria sordida]